MLKNVDSLCLYTYKTKELNGQVQLKDLRKNHENLFWNLVYYLNEYQLPFEFILPYESNVQQLKFDSYKKEIKKQVVKTESSKVWQSSHKFL